MSRTPGRHRTLADYRDILRRPRPRWSIRTTSVAALAIVAIASVLTLLVLRKPLWVELEALTGLLSVVVFMFFGHVLYRGIRFNKHERFDFSLRTVSLQDVWDGAASGVDGADLLEAVDAGDGIIGFLVGLLVSLVLIVGLGLVLWIGLNVVFNAVIVVSIPLFYFFRRSLRHVVVRGRTCRGNLPRSFRVAAWMTFFYMGWFYSLIFFAHLLHEKLRGP